VAPRHIALILSNKSFSSRVCHHVLHGGGSYDAESIAQAATVLPTVPSRRKQALRWRIMMSKQTIYGIGAFALAATISSTAWAVSATPMIAVGNQVPDGRTVNIAEVEIPHDGFVVIHTTKDGKPVMTQYVGDTRVKAGFHQNVNVKLDQKPKPGTTYFAMLYDGSGRTGKFEFGPGKANVDKPLMLNGKEVSELFKIDKAEK
jgi:hypothetical protein